MAVRGFGWLRRVALVIAALVVAPLAGCDGSEGASGRLALAVADRVRVGSAPQGVAVTDDAVWVTVAGELRLLRIDPEGGEALASVRFANIPSGLAVTGGSVWVGFAEGRSIVRLSETAPAADRRRIRVGQTPQAIAPAEDGDGVWVAALNDPSVVHVDGAGRVADKIRLRDGFPGAVAVGFERVWVPDVVANLLLEIDPGEGRRTGAVRVGNSPTAVAVGEGGVWVGNFESGTVSHVDPEGDEVVGGIRVGGPVGGVAVGAGYVWVTEQERGRLLAIDPETDDVVGAVEVGPVPQGIAVGPDGSVWVAVQNEGVLVRVVVR